jgi:hypothetical protein
MLKIIVAYFLAEVHNVIGVYHDVLVLIIYGQYGIIKRYEAKY